MRPKVLLIEPSIHQSGIERLAQGAELLFAPDGHAETLISYLGEGDIDALITRVEKVPARVIDAARGLRLIGQHGVGVDNIDVAAATRRGITIVNSPRANTVSTAEHAIALMLGVLRHLPAAHRAVCSGDFEFRERCLPTELSGKSLLVVGLGNIGRQVANMCRTAFAMRVLAYDPFVAEDTMRLIGLEKVVELADGLARADVVTLHVPHNRDTHHLIDAHALALLHPGAVLINCARGPVVCEQDLTEALRCGTLAAAGLDVFEQEPPDPGSALLRLDNVVLTPHFGGDTAEAKLRCSLDLADEVLRVLAGKPARFLVTADAI